jgi:hypothetical protein
VKGCAEHRPFGTGVVARLSRRLAGAGAALVVAWPLLPVLSHYNVAGALVYVAGALLLIGSALGVYLSVTAAWTGPRFPRPLAYLAAANTFVVGAVGSAVG